MGGDFKNREMPPEPDAGQQLAGEPPAESHAGPHQDTAGEPGAEEDAGQPAPARPAPLAEDQGTEVGILNVPDSQPGTAAEPEPADEADYCVATPSKPAPQAEDRRPPVKGVFKTPSSVIRTIVDNQRYAEWWGHREDLETMRRGGEKLIHGLGLWANDEGWDDEASGEPARGPWAKDEGSEKLGVPLIKIEKLNIRTLADYRPQADGYAIAGTIVINEERLRALDLVQKLVLMLVMLVRVRQHLRGGDGRLDREGRALLKAKGVVVTEKGKITITDGAFRRFLEAEGIEAPATSAFPQPERRGRSTLQIWSCSCGQKCRVGTKVFRADCPECHEPFRPGDHRDKRLVPTGT